MLEILIARFSLLNILNALVVEGREVKTVSNESVSVENESVPLVENISFLQPLVNSADTNKSVKTKPMAAFLVYFISCE